MIYKELTPDEKRFLEQFSAPAEPEDNTPVAPLNPIAFGQVAKLLGKAKTKDEFAEMTPKDIEITSLAKSVYQEVDEYIKLRRMGKNPEIDEIDNVDLVLGEKPIFFMATYIDEYHNPSDPSSSNLGIFFGSKKSTVCITLERTTYSTSADPQTPQYAEKTNLQLILMPDGHCEGLFFKDARSKNLGSNATPQADRDATLHALRTIKATIGKAKQGAK